MSTDTTSNRWIGGPQPLPSGQLTANEFADQARIVTADAVRLKFELRWKTEVCEGDLQEFRDVLGGTGVPNFHRLRSARFEADYPDASTLTVRLIDGYATVEWRGNHAAFMAQRFREGWAELPERSLLSLRQARWLRAGFIGCLALLLILVVSVPAMRGVVPFTTSHLAKVWLPFFLVGAAIGIYVWVSFGAKSCLRAVRSWHEPFLGQRADRPWRNDSRFIISTVINILLVIAAFLAI